jgi:hypothetical protein
MRSKDADKSVLACPSILGCLKYVSVMMDKHKLLRKRTIKRTPIPENMTFAGENTYQMNMRA